MVTDIIMEPNFWENVSVTIDIFVNILALFGIVVAVGKWIQAHLEIALYRHFQKNIGTILRKIQLEKESSWLTKMKLKFKLYKKHKTVFKKWREKITEGEKITPAYILSTLAISENSDSSLAFLYSKSDLNYLSSAFRKLSTKLKKTGLFSQGLPILERVSQLSEETATLLTHYASSKVVTPNGFSYYKFSHMNNSDVIYLSPSHKRYKNFSSFRIRSSWVDNLYVPKSGYFVKTFGELTPTTVNYVEFSNRNRRLSGLTQSPFLYDGILPAIVDDSNIRIEVDERSGTPYLHFSLVETTYSTVVALRDEPSSITIPRLMTLSMLVLSADNILLCPKRTSNSDSYKNCYNSTVNGNLDMPSRSVHGNDVDLFGIPSVVQAIIREAKEEMNLDLLERDVLATGIGKIKTDDDNLSYILSFFARSELTADEIILRSKFADPTRGAWEILQDFEKIQLPTNKKEAIACMVNHLKNYSNYTPHLMITLVGAFISQNLIAIDDVAIKIDSV